MNIEYTRRTWYTVLSLDSDFTEQGNSIGSNLLRIFCARVLVVLAAGQSDEQPVCRASRVPVTRRAGFKAARVKLCP